MELQTKAFSIKIPNVLMTAIFVLATAALFVLLDNPDYALWASGGLIAVGALAKALEVNYGDVLKVLGKTEEDVPTIDELTSGVRPQAIGSLDAVKTPDDIVFGKTSKVQRWMIG